MASFQERVIGAMRLQPSTFEEVEHDATATPQAAIVVAAVGLANGLAWVWYGGIIMAIGGLIVMWPQATPAGAKRRAEGGYVVVMQPSERDKVEAGVP